MHNMDETQKKVLALILRSGQIRGFELQQEASVEGAELSKAASQLIDMGLITASGVVNPETLDRVVFAPLSSAFEKSNSLLR
jgi:DNA-binding MarR family transcriptional regulator